MLPQRFLLLAGVFTISGCWKLELAELTNSTLAFDPRAGAPRGWIVAPVPVPLECPDGAPIAFQMVFPADRADEPLPVAVIYHPGAFDFVFSPEAGEPTVGASYATPTRLTASWALGQVFETLGMYPADDPTQAAEGRLAAALAERDVAMMLPPNCWGDLWHNVRGSADNDFALDFFFRDGRAAADWGYRFLADPTFGAALGVTLPMTPDPERIYLIGLGEGGRAVGEVLALDNNLDGLPDHSPKAALVDSSPDDLRRVFDDPGSFGNMIGGLTRIFPKGRWQTVPSSLHTAPLPPRLGYLYSNADPEVDPILHEAALARFALEPSVEVFASEDQVHLILESEDDDLRDAALDLLLDEG